MKNFEIRVQGYETDSGAYFKRGAGNLERIQEEPHPSWFFYSAFEFRCCIEQTLRLYLDLILLKSPWELTSEYTEGDVVRHNDSAYMCTTAHIAHQTNEPEAGGNWTEYWDLFDDPVWSKSLEKLYRAKDLKNKILSFEPEFELKLKFVDLLMRSVGLPSVFIIDLDKLNRLYGRIGDYMHAQIKPHETVENPKWWGAFYFLLREVETYMREVLNRPIAHFQLNERGWSLYEPWKNESKSDLEVMDEFRVGIGI